MTLRYEAAATCLSWIPPTSVQGLFRLPYGLGIAHYGQPPPDKLPDVEVLLVVDAVRFANQLHAWIEVEDPRPVIRPPLWRLAAPVAWTTITLTLRADGKSTCSWTACRSSRSTGSPPSRSAPVRSSTPPCAPPTAKSTSPCTPGRPAGWLSCAALS
jgi:hypothetical protein